MTFTTRRRLAVLGLGVLLVTVPAWGRRHETGFLDRVATVNGVDYRYQVFVPRNWNPKVKWPVVLFLHGYAEEGDDGILPTEVGIAPAIRNHVDRFPFVVVIPQCRKKDWWTSAPMSAGAQGAGSDSQGAK